MRTAALLLALALVCQPDGTFVYYEWDPVAESWDEAAKAWRECASRENAERLWKKGLEE